MEKIIYSSIEQYSEESREKARQNLIENGVENPTESNIDEELNSINDIVWKETKDDLIAFFKDKTVIFFGSVGAWNGKRKRAAVGDFTILFKSMTRSCDDIEILERDNHFIIKGYHHDGTNEFEVKILSYDGINYYDHIIKKYSDVEDLSDKDAKKIVDDLHDTIIKNKSYYPGYLSGEIYIKPVRTKFDINKFRKKGE